MKNPVVQTSLPGLARNLEGLQKMQVSGGAGGGGSLGAHGDALTPLSPRRGTARWPGGSQRRRGALWQMQNSTVQSQEALVVSLCRAGGSGAAGTAQRCPLEGNDGAFEPFSPPCHTGKAGGKRPVPLPLGTAPQGTRESLPALKIMRCPGGPICQKTRLQGDGRARKNASQENWSPLVVGFALANQKSPCKGVFLLRAHPSFPALRQPDPT